MYHAVSPFTNSVTPHWLAGASTASPPPVNIITPTLVLRFPGNQRLATTTRTDLLSPIEAGVHYALCIPILLPCASIPSCGAS